MSTTIREFGKQMAEALGAPPRCRKFTIEHEVGSFPLIKFECFLTSSDGMEKVIETYRRLGPAVHSEASFYRASGDEICEVCGLEFKHHRESKKILDNEGRPFLRELCNGDLVKL